MAARALPVRPLTAEEGTARRRRAAARTLPARVVERAKLLLRLHEGARVPAVAGRLGVGADVGRTWRQRFTAAGLGGVRDRPRSGRPATSGPAQVGEVIAASLTKPDARGLPFGSWTRDRLPAYLNEVTGLPIKRSRIGELLPAEGRRWRRPAPWVGERVAPALAATRGPSSRPTRPRLRIV